MCITWLDNTAVKRPNFVHVQATVVFHPFQQTKVSSFSLSNFYFKPLMCVITKFYVRTILSRIWYDYFCQGYLWVEIAKSCFYLEPSFSTRYLKSQLALKCLSTETNFDQLASVFTRNNKFHPFPGFYTGNRQIQVRQCGLLLRKKWLDLRWSYAENLNCTDWHR